MRCPILLLTLLGALTLVGCQQSRAHRTEDPYGPYGGCVNQLRMIDGAKQQWALVTGAGSNAVPTWDDIRPYLVSGGLPKGETLRCHSGGQYTIGRVGEPPTCSVGGTHTLP